MRTSLRWKILSLVVLAPLVLGLAALATVDFDVRKHVDRSSIHESLEHSVSVFESMLQTRSRALAGGGRVVVGDPRFFSLVMLKGVQRDSRFTATVRGMASDFNRITQTDVFEVFDRRGRLLASVGGDASSQAAREPLLRPALRGTPSEGLLVEGESHFQAAATPVMADGRVVGVLLLGARVDQTLARLLQSQMRCEVTFLAGDRVTGTTLSTASERTALGTLMKGLRIAPETDLRALGVLRAQSDRGTYLTLVRRIPGSDPAQLQLYVMQRAFDPETTFMHEIRRDLLRLALLALAIAILSGWWLSDQILRPLHALVRGARAMETGNYDQPVVVQHRDEIGYLADRFIEMRRRERAYVSNLEHVSKLKSDFISVASRELRAPISGLSAYHGLFTGGMLGPVSKAQQQALAAIEGFIARLTSVADDATLVAQVQGERLLLDIRPCDVAPLVRLSLGMARAQGDGRPVTVNLECPPTPVRVEVDEKALAQAVTHLVRNALHFAPDAGEVSVRVEECGGLLRIEVGSPGVALPDTWLETLLRDGRLPADEDEPAKAVDFRVAELGLGLSIARSVAEAHGGTLAAEAGTHGERCLALRLPLSQPRDEESEAAAA